MIVKNLEFEITACRYPYHFNEWLRDCPSYKVYLILADFVGRDYDALVKKQACKEIRRGTSRSDKNLENQGFLPLPIKACEKL